MSKRILSMVLMLIMVFTNIPIAYAAGTEQEALSKVHLYAKGTGTQLLKWQGEIHEDFAPAMVMYKDSDGSEMPAYCINPNKPGVEESDSKSYDVNADTSIQSAKAWGCVINGYPYKTAEQLGLKSDYEAYYSTKMALWCIMYSHYNNINDWSPNGENNQHVYNAMKSIYQAGMATSEIPKTGSVTATPLTEKTVDDDKDNNYLSQVFTVTSTGNYTVSLDSTAPTGTKITDEQNNDKTSFNQGEKFKVLIPKTNTERKGNFNININTDSSAKVILYGSSLNEATQDYVVTTKKPIGGSIKATVTYEEKDGDEPTTEPNTEVETESEPEITPITPTPIPTPTPSTPGTLKFVKVEAGTTKGLAGAVFRVTDADGGVIGEYITDGNGQVTVALENIGAYYVDEIEPPYGYQIDKNSHKDIVVKKDTQAVLTFTNKPNTDLTITKVDADTGEKLAKATIRVALDEGNKFQDVTTDTMGMAKVPNLPEGTYTVTEITAPSGYILDNTPYTIKIESGKTVAITLKNKAKPGLLIKKFDEGTGFPLEKAEFSVKKKDGSIVYEGITGKDGTIKIENLEPDWYTVTEIAAPPGYLITTESKDVKLEENKVTEVKFDNRKRPSLQIMKVDSQTNKPLKGAKFYVKKADGETVSEYITDESGTVTITDLEESVYIVWEFESPDGYLLDTTHKDIQLEWGKTKTLVFTNKAKPSLEILKIDEETKEPLKGAKFRITQTESKTTSEYVTDENGRILITDLEDKIYTVEEIVAPTGYLLENQHKDIQLEWGKCKQLVFTNRAKPSLEILKIDEETKEPLKGAKFRITQTESKTTSEYVTDENGRILITDLEDKIYTVEEIIAPAGYLLENQHKDIQLEWGKCKQLVFTNKAKPKLRILKVDATTGHPLKNAEFRVTKVEDKTVNEYITDEKGEILVENLDEAIYKVEEFMPPAGYDLYTESKEIALNWGKTKTLKFDNIRKPVLVFLKSNGLTGKPVKGSTFKVEYEMPNGGIKTIGSYKTDENGQIIIPKVNAGWYILTETMPAIGFSLPKNPVTRIYVDKGENAYLPEMDKYYQSKQPSANNILNSNNIKLPVSNTLPNKQQAISNTQQSVSNTQVTNSKIEYSSGSKYYSQGEGWNFPLNSIVIKKTDAITGELLAGASFELYRADEQVSGVPGTNIGRYTTDNSGVVVITGLEPGYYVVKEVQAPQNYLISENSQQNGFLKTDGTTILEFTFSNYPYGSILITKTDGITKKPLANAKFKITDNSGAAVGNGEYTTNSKGEILINKVKPGSYVVTEIQAPDNYVTNNTSKTVEVGTDGKTYTLSFDNYPYGAVLITKIDGVTKEPLANAKFKITDNDGKAVGNSNGEYTTNSKGEILINNIKPGSYVVTEIQAPDNYALNDTPKTIEVKPDGKTQKLSFDNYPYSSILITKVGVINQIPIFYNLKVWKQSLIGTVIVLTVEYISGFILNIIFKLNIWDYSNLRFNLNGQICLTYAVLWFVLMPTAIWIEDYLRFMFWKEGHKYGLINIYKEFVTFR